MNYILYKRFKAKAICGEVNLPYGTEVKCENGILTIECNPICGDHSQNAYDYFARNDDGNGLERGKLIQEIIKCLSKRDKDHQDRWNKVWEDALCQKYKRTEHTDYWLWNHDFYNAEIKDLKYIANLIGAKGVD